MLRSIKLKYLLSIFILFTVLLSNLSASAQGEKKFVTFSGFVIDGSNDEPLPGAYVINDRAGRGVFTNVKGYFIIDVFPGDSILFSFLGFRKQFHIIPKNIGLDYSAVVELSIDAKMLREVKVYPFRTEEEFKTAFLEMELPNQRERELLEKNYSNENIKRMAANQAMGSGGNYRYAMDQQMMHLQGQKQVTVNPLTNPFAWRNFIQSVKSGSLTDKAWKKGTYIPAERGSRDNIFKGSN
ncbi:carboxypeptidase-like regulatory domain-containing protein [Lacihabitans sp. LS3-19]|nr:carboxypeptidase-like regulatory domain-containing protein [Lacihabitans sp. LS3-19]